jgi:hypothetical protein
MQKQQFCNNILYVRNVHLTKCQAYIVFIRDKSMSSERMLHKDYYHKGSVGEKNFGRGSQGAWRQDKLFGRKPPIVN